MSWPLSQDYNEAIQDPRSSFGDAELKTGEAFSNALGIPMPRSGNFADVYEVRCPSGARWAVKCFTREVHGLRERYAEISKYLHRVNLPFMVDFRYLEQGIRVRGQWYPVLKMQWVEGFVLNDFVRDNLDKKPILNSLGQIWLRMSRRLREAKLAHCDLQHGNVLFVPGSSANSLAVKLIDYDGMCVPSLANKNSGEVGHPAYQHPERLRTGAYNGEVDRFSLLGIAAALRCLIVGGRSLWERYDNGDNLLFRQTDLQSPAESPLFRELLTIGDPQAQALVKALYRACQAPLSSVPLLSEFVPDKKPTGKVTMATGRSEAIAEIPDWDFGDVEPSTPIRRKGRSSGGMPLWHWGALGAAAAFLLSVGVGAALFLSKAPEKKESTSVAPSNLAANVPKPEPESQLQTKPVEQPPQKPTPAEDVSRGEGGLGGIFALTPTGDKLAISGSGDKQWRLVDPRTKRTLQEFTGHTGQITSIAFSTEGTRAVTGDSEGVIRRWDVQTGQLLGFRPMRGKPVLGLAVSADGNKVAATDGGPDTRFWDFAANISRGYRHGNRSTTSIAFTPDGRYLVFGFDASDKARDEVLFLWPLVRELSSRGFRGPASPTVTCLAVSPDGKYIAAGHAGNRRTVSLWETATGRFLRQSNMPEQSARSIGSIHQVAFSPNARFVVASAANQYSVWPVEPATEGMGEAGEADSTQDIVSAAFTPDSGGVTLVYRKADRVGLVQTVRLPGSAPAVSQPPAMAGQTVVWQPPVDPDGDCKFQNAGSKLTITVPGKDHDLGAERGRMNAPRLLFDVEGDFTAQVRVSGDFQPSTDSTVNGKVPVVGAGLVMLLDDRTYVRLERFGVYRGQQFQHFVSWERRRSARPDFTATSQPLTGNETYLRMERRGNNLFGSVSADGLNWFSLSAVNVDLPQQVKLGVDAITTSSRPFAPNFDRFQLKKGQGEMVRIDWPSLPAATPIVVKPSPTPPPRPRLARNSRLEAECRTLEETLTKLPAKSKDKFRQLTHRALLLADRALIDEDFDTGKRLLEIAKTSAAKADASMLLGKMVDQKAKQLSATREEYDPIQGQADKLEKDPNDADANLAVGRFRCFIRNDWDAGLPLLANGSDKTLSELALKDWFEPADAAARAALGDAWLERADNSKGKEQSACRRRAYSWYLDCVDELDAKNQLRLNTRLKKLAVQLAEPNNPFPELDIGTATPTRRAGTAMLRLTPQQRIATRQHYRGPIDIRVTALLPKNHIRITFLNGGEMSLSPRDIRTAEVKYFGHYAADPDKEGGSWGPTVRSTSLPPPNSLQQIRILATESSCNIWINDKKVLSQGSSPPFTRFASSPVRVWSDDGEVDLLALAVKRVRSGDPKTPRSRPR